MHFSNQYKQILVSMFPNLFVFFFYSVTFAAYSLGKAQCVLQLH